jgi:hypothetical protein
MLPFFTTASADTCEPINRTIREESGKQIDYAEESYQKCSQRVTDYTSINKPDVNAAQTKHQAHNAIQSMQITFKAHAA